jgi:glycolate oxidase
MPPRALIVELDGLQAGIDAQSRRVADICTSHRARSVHEATDEIERKRLWAGRKGGFSRAARTRYALTSSLRRTRWFLATKLPAVLAGIYAIGSRYNLKMSTVFHAGDGNLHPNLNFDGRDQDEVERVLLAGKRLCSCASMPVAPSLASTELEPTRSAICL